VKTLGLEMIGNVRKGGRMKKVETTISFLMEMYFIRLI
jgi:hypothetical protein